MRFAAKALIGLLCLAPPAGAARDASCAMKGSKTIRADTRARVFVHRSRANGTVYYACLYRNGRRREIPLPDEAYRGWTLASPYLSYLEPGGASTVSVDVLWVYDIRTGMEYEAAEAVQSEEGSSAIENPLLAPTGAVAWIRARTRPDSARTQVITERSVEKWSPAGEATLDPGPTVDAGSLALSTSGRRVYWTNAGEPRSARLR
jgi:hypothetical protein